MSQLNVEDVPWLRCTNTHHGMVLVEAIGCRMACFPALVQSQSPGSFPSPFSPASSPLHPLIHVSHVSDSQIGSYVVAIIDTGLVGDRSGTAVACGDERTEIRVTTRRAFSMPPLRLSARRRFLGCHCWHRHCVPLAPRINSDLR
jgi:hypothetical protein